LCEKCEQLTLNLRYIYITTAISGKLP